MASKYWVKLYIEILDDPKMGTMTDRLFRRTMQLFLLAGDLNGSGNLPSVPDMAWRLRLGVEELETDLANLASAGIVHKVDSCWVVTKFEDRQAPVSSTERVQRYRKRTIHYPRDQKTQNDIYEKLPTSPGVYKIEFKGDEKCYIGSSKDIRQRISQHLTEMRTMVSNKLHAPYMKFGFDNVDITILERTSSLDQLPILESEWLSKFPSSELYNTEVVAGSHRDWNNKGTYRSTDTDTDIDIEKEEELNGVTAETPPPAPVKKAKSKKKRDPLLDNPAIIAYREEFHYHIQIAWREEVCNTVDNPERWEKVIHEWNGKGWNPKNVQGMLDVYRNGGIGKKKQEPAGFEGLRDYAKEQGWTDGE